MAFDSQTLNLIIAGDEAGAIVRLDAGHPNELLNTMGATIERAAAQLRATSATSNTIGPGPFTFTITEGNLSWRQGDQVVIRAASAPPFEPETHFMNCTLTADQDAGTGDITVSVDSSVGSGTPTSWELLLTVFILAATVAPPFTQAQGAFGTDVSTPAGAAIGRDGLEIPRMVKLAGVESDPVAAEVIVGLSSSVFILVADGGTGAFATHDNEIAELTAPATWAFTVPQESDLLWDGDGDVLYAAFIGGGEGAADDVVRLSNPFPASTTVSASDFAVVFDVDTPHFDIFVDSGSARIITLYNPGKTAYTIRVWRLGTGTVTINVAGGGTVNGVASVTVGAQFDSRLCIQTATGVFSAND